MSNIIPPMVSSTPPPMDDNIDDDEDDEFGDFASASLSYGTDVQPSNSVGNLTWETNEKPLSPVGTNDTQSRLKDESCESVLKSSKLTPVKQNGTCGRDSDPTTTDDDEEVECPVLNKCYQLDQNRTSKCDIMRVKEIQQDNTSQDSVVSGATDSGLCSASQNSEGTSPLPHGDEMDRLSPVLLTTSGGKVENTNKELFKMEKSGIENEYISERTFVDHSSVSVIPSGDTSSDTLNSAVEKVKDNMSSENVNRSVCCNNEMFETVGKIVTIYKKDRDVEQVCADADSNSLERMTVDNLDNFSEFQSTLENSADDSVVHVLNCPSYNSNTKADIVFCKEFGDQSMLKELNEHVLESEDSACMMDTLVQAQCEISDAAGDEFGAFEKAPTSDSCNNSESTPFSQAVDMIFKHESSDDEFAEFAAASEPLHSFFPESQSVEKITSSSWADVPVVEAETSMGEVDDDFDDFEMSEFHPYEMQSGGDSDKVLERIEILIKELFPTETRNGMEEICPIESGTLTEYLDSVSPVWDKLRIIESSHALTYQWSGSTSNKALLSSLGIDSRNILFGPRWNASIPRFAANLGFSPLEPVRATGSSVNPPLSLPSSSKETPRSSLVENSENSGNEDSVPAAQFDWNSSGLVNPLDCTQSALLDLDYLNTFDNFASSSSSAAAWELTSLEKDLEPQKDVTSAATQPTTQTAQLVQRILAASQSIPLDTAQRRDGLSPEAIKVLDSLPDLSFLQTKMLMFPVHTPSPEHSVSASDG